MEETKNIEKKGASEKRMYISAPQLKKPYTSPAVAVGVGILFGENGPKAMRILIRRDLNVKLSSFEVKFRFSSLPLACEDEENQYFDFVYDKPDINTKEYFSIPLNHIPVELKENCTPMVSAVTYEHGKRVTYRISDFEEAVTGYSPQLREYFAFMIAREKNNSPRSGSGQGEETQGAAVQSVPNDPVTKPRSATEAVPSVPPKKKIRKSRRSVFGTPGGILVLVLLVAALGAVAATVFDPHSGNTPSASSETVSLSRKEVSNLTAAKDFSEAYRLVSSYEEETALLQEVCGLAVKHYLSIRDFERAYLYASAAPEPFSGEVYESFVEYFAEEGRYREAYDFLSSREDGAEALQTLCANAVDFYLAERDFENAYFYAAAAPQSLEEKVFALAEKSFVEEGTVNPGALAILQKKDDAGELDTLISETVGELEDFDTAYSMAISIKDETIRAKAVLDVSMERMKTLVDENDLTGAYELFTDASSYWKETQKIECLTRMISYSSIHKNTAGAIFFRKLSGEDTSSVEVAAEDLSVRANPEAVYFHLTEKQKRSYHAVCFDLYKEPYYILSGALQGTDITDAVSVSVSEFLTLVLHADGTVSAPENNVRNLTLEMPERKDVVQISAGQNHAVFLHADGTVSASGSNPFGQLNVGAWTNVVKIVAGADFTAGLLSDGTLVACGSNLSGQCNVSEYAQVLDIAACDQSLVLLFRDGSVKVVGDVSLGLKRADYFNNVKRIRAAASCIIAETEKGSFLMAHEAANADGGTVMRWSNVRWFAAGALCIGNVDTYGRVNIEGDGTPVKGE